MSGSYIDPCESGAYQGSGSVGSEGSGSWNGSGSGNDSITSENCCPQPVAGVACCVPGSLKMRLFQSYAQSYLDPDTVGDPYYPLGIETIWGTVQHSRIFTLTKTVFCDENFSTAERWVIEDPDSNFGDWGDLTGAYFTTEFNIYYGDVQYSLILPNSPVQYIKRLMVQCKCESPGIDRMDGSRANSMVKCRGCFLARSNVHTQLYKGSGATEYSFFNTLPLISDIYRHQVMIWGSQTDLEECYGISDTPPEHLHSQHQIATDPCTVDNFYDWANKGFTSKVYTNTTVQYWKRTPFAFRRGVGLSGSYGGHEMYTNFPPFYGYVDCRFPIKKGEGDRKFRSYMNTARLGYMSYYNGYAGAGYVCGDPNTYVVKNSWFYQQRNDDYLFTYLMTFPYALSTPCAVATNDPARSPTGSCTSKPLSVSPVYDHLYIGQYASPSQYYPVCDSVTMQSLPCEQRLGAMRWQTPGQYRVGTTTRLVITEAPACVIIPPPPPPASGVVPGYPAPIPPPGSGSTPTQSGSAPFSGPGSQPPCGGDCSYNFAWAYLGKDGVWYLNYKYSSSTCTEWCACDVNVVGEIYVNYNGPEGGWPLVLNLPCVPAVVMGSTSEA